MIEEQLLIRKNALREYGFSEEEIQEHINKKRNAIIAFKKADEVNEKEEDSVLGGIKRYWNNVVDSVKESTVGEKFEPQLYWERGLGKSTLNLAKQYHTGNGVFDADYLTALEPEPEDTGHLERFIETAGTIFGDAPSFAAGGFVGGLLTSGSAAGVGFGGGFVTEGMRQTYISALQKGQVEGPGEWWDLFIQNGIKEATKSGIVMGAGLAAPGVLTRLGSQSTLLKLGTQYSVFAGLGPALEGRLPTKDELVNVGLVMAAFGGVGYGAQKATKMVMDRVGKSKKDTQQVLEEISKNPDMLEDVMSSNIKDFRRKVPEGEKLETAFEGGKPLKTKEEIAKETKQKIVDKPETPFVSDSAAMNNILSKIQYKKEKVPLSEYFKDSKSKFISQYIDRLHPIYQMQKAYNKFNGDPKKTMDAYGQLQIQPGQIGKGIGFVQTGTFKFFEPSKITGDGLLQIVNKYGITNEKAIKEFDGYQTAKRVVERESKGLKTGFDLNSAKQVSNSKEYQAKYEKAFRESEKSEKAINQILVDSGVISKEQLSLIESASKDYTPFARILESEAGITGKTTGDIRNPFKKFTGKSEKDILPATETRFLNTFHKMAIAERNFAANKFLDLVRANPELFPNIKKTSKTKVTRLSKEELNKLVDNPKSLKPEVAEGLSIFRKDSFVLNEKEIAVRVNGKTEVWEVGPEISKALKDMTTQEANLLVKTLEPFSKTLRLGATLAPDFMVRNFTRDTLMAAVFSKETFLPFYNSITGFKSLILRGDKTYEKFVKSGAMQSMFISMDRNYFMKDLQSAIGAGKVHNQIKSPLEMLRVAAELFEVSTRMGEFKLTYKRLKKENKLTDKEMLESAGLNARNITLDFGRMGTKVGAWNRINAFLNAGIQGNLRLYEAFRDNPIKTTVRINSFIVAPSIMLWLVNHDDERYKQLPRWQKDLFWIFITGDGTVDDGDYTVWRVPKPYGPGILFGTGTEKTLDWFLDNDKESMKLFLKDQIGAFSTLTGLLPDFVRPALELQTNQNFFTKQAIVPRYLEKSLPEYQYTEYTSATGKIVGKFLAETTNGTLGSPASFDHIISSWTGTLGRYALELSDAILLKFGVVDEPEAPEKTLSDIPFIKAFVVRNPTGGSEYVERFYNKFNKISKKLNSIDKLTKEFNTEEAFKVYGETDVSMLPLIEIQKAMSAQTKWIKAIYNSDMKPEEKRQSIDETYRAMIMLAKTGLELTEDTD